MPAVTPNMVESSLAAPALPWTHQMKTVPSTLPACGKEGVVVSTCMQTVPSTLPAYMRMENLRLAKHLLWLPGGCYWSSSLNRFMAMGSSLTMPRDFAPSFSLNAFMLLERCGERCVISFNSSGFQRLAICESLSSSFMEHETHTQALARQLAHFVHEQLSPDCVDRYMLALLEGIPQEYRAPSRDRHGCKSVTAHHGVLLSPQVIEHPHAIGASFEQAQSWASLNMSWPRVPVTFLPFECAMYMATHRRLRELPGAALNALHWHGCTKSDCESAYSLSCSAVRGGLACFARFPAGRRAPGGEQASRRRSHPRATALGVVRTQRLSLSAPFLLKLVMCV